MEYLQSLMQDADLVHFVTTVYVCNLATWGCLAIFYELCHHFRLFQDRLVRPVGNYPPPDLIKAALIQNLLGNLVLYPIFAVLIYKIYVHIHGSVPLEWPALPLIPFQILFCMLVEDTMFYWTHRTLHHRRIYKYIHKQHHKFRDSIGLAAEYAHPVENLFGNVVPLWMGPMLLNASLPIICLWSILRVWEAHDSHSGYRFAWSPWNLFLTIQGGVERHDFHHSHNKGCYGSFFSFWDRFCGTDEAFRNYQAKKHEIKAQATDAQ